MLSLAFALTGCTMNKNNTNSDSSVKTVKRNKTRESLPQKKYQVLEQDWNINQDGVNIYGRLYLPQNLPGQGYVAYAFDYPGGAKNGCSTGVGQLNMSIFTEEQNLKTVLNAVRNRSDVDRYQVSLLGESQGGAVSAMLASKYPKEVKSLILLYPAFSITDYAQVAFKSINRVPDTLNLFGFTVGKNYFAKLFNYDLLKSATKYNGPVLIMHGTDDIIVPETYSEKANKKFKHSKLYIFKHAGHDFKGKYVTRANRLITDFLKKN